MSLWFPRLPIDVIRRRDRRASRSPDPRPILVFERSGSRQTVVQACERAIGHGVRVGMSLGDARAGFAPGSVRIEELAPERLGSVLVALATWALRISPTVALDPPDGLLLDVTGCEGVWRSEERMRGALVDGMARLGIEARAAVAPSIGTAWAVARFGDGSLVVPEGGAHAAIEALPVECLRLSGEVVEGLRALGLERVGDLLVLPRHSLPARFGPDVLLRLDQALGHAIETLDPIRPDEPPRVERVFDGVTARWDAIEACTRALLGELCDLLRSKERGVTLLELEVSRSDLPPVRLACRFARPTRRASHLWLVVRPRLERVHLGFGVDGLAVCAAGHARITHEQGEHWRGEDDAARARSAEVLDTLVGRFGTERVTRRAIRESHVPERATVAAPVDTPSSPVRWEGGDRPSWLLARPTLVEAMALTPDGPVLSITVDGETHPVHGCVGPERIGPEWWNGDCETRDYFKLQDARGRWVWAYREVATRRWFLHGVWA